jgi:hypothetical protein
MGCDIHMQAERQVNGKWYTIPGHFFDWRSYSNFAFLAGVRNYSDITPISDPRGLPEDAADSDDEYGGARGGDHSFSWLSLEELLAFNYDAITEDRRVTVQIGPNCWNGGATAEPGGGETMTYREYLGEVFFEELEKLKAAGAERIVFGFDS